MSVNAATISTDEIYVGASASVVLTDYLDGDHYFAVHREGQNLDRCRTQFKLVSDMEAQFEAMAAVVKKYAK